MAYISPGVYTKIKDLSGFVQQVPGTIGFLCALTEKGEDNKVKYLSGRDELVEEFGKPNISLYGANYSQGPYVAYNYLGESGAFYFMRCLPDDATYSNLRIYGNTDASNVYFIDYVSDINNATDIASAMVSWGNNTPLVLFYPIGRGSYYNNLGIEITEDEKRPGEGIYHLDIYETQSDGTYTMIESYTISFDQSAVTLNPGESIFVEYVLEQYSQVLRATVSQDGFDLMERLYYDSQTDPSRDGATATGATGPGATGGGSTECQVSISSVGETSYIDQTTVTHTVIYDGNFWATTSNLPEPKGNSPTSFGSINSAFICGGIGVGVTASQNNQVRKWNGSVWSNTTAMSDNVYGAAGCGDPDTGGLVIGGDRLGEDNNRVDKWNGSAWATTTVINTTRQTGQVAVGDDTDAIMTGGGTSASAQKNTEVWDGSTWTTTSRTSVYHQFPSIFGDTTSCVVCGGITADGGTNPAGNKVEKYYATYPLLYLWATTSNLNYSQNEMGGLGVTNAAMSLGGSYVQNVSLWNGSTWGTTSIISQGVSSMGTCGVTSAAMRYAGAVTGTGANSVVTELFNGSTWSTQGNFPTWGYLMGSCGTTSAGLAVGGGYYQYSGNYNNTGLADVYKFNGSVWSTTTSILVIKIALQTCGTTSSALQFGGGTAGTGQYSDLVESFNGSVWATTTEMGYGRNSHDSSTNSPSNDLTSTGGNGNQTDKEFKTRNWNGSVWSNGQDMNVGRASHGGAGAASTSAMVFGGNYDGNSTEIISPQIVEVFVWSTTPSLNNIIKYPGGCGPTHEHGIVFGGMTASDYADRVDRTEEWDGSTWSTTSAQNVARTEQTGCGTHRNALSMGGNATSFTGRLDTTEIWYPTFATHTHITHTYIPVIIDIYQLTDTQKDFGPYETDPEVGDASYVAIVTDSSGNTIWGWLGDSTGEENHVINVWKNKDLDTSDRGWSGDIGVFNQSDCNMFYVIKKSYDETGEGIPGLFSVQPLKKGTEGSLIVKGTFDTSVADQILAQGYAGELDVI